MVLARYHCDPEKLIDAVGRFPSKRIIVIGDLMLDCFIFGAVSRISPEAPVPVVEILKETTCLGGAANVAANIRSLGGGTVPIGVIGDDGDGRKLQDVFCAQGMPLSGLVIDGNRATSVKTRIIAHHQQVCRTDREDKSPMPAEIGEAVADRFRLALDGADAVVISDYAKGLLSRPLLRQILAMARGARKPVCVDPKLHDLSAYRTATVITPNTAEAERASGVTISSQRALVQAGRRILDQTGIRNLLITRGEHGMALFEGAAPVKNIPTVAREVFDVTGAGDTVISTVALGLVAGLSMLEAAILSNIAAGIVVGKLGTASTTPDELVARIREY